MNIHAISGGSNVDTTTTKSPATQETDTSGPDNVSDQGLVRPRAAAGNEVRDAVDPSGDGAFDNTAAIAYAIMGDASKELSTQALLNLERIIMAVIMDRVTLDGKNTTPVVQFADNLEEGEVLEDQPGNVLPANVNGAYVSGRNGKPGTILISEDLRDDPAKLAAVMLEEVGEAIGDHAGNHGFQAAAGDVGDRIRQVVREPSKEVTFEVTDGGLDEAAELDPNINYDEQYVMLSGVRMAAKTATGTSTDHDVLALSIEWGVTTERATEIVSELDVTMYGPPFTAESYPHVIGWSELIDKYGVVNAGQLTLYELGAAMADDVVTTALTPDGVGEANSREVDHVNLPLLESGPSEPDPLTPEEEEDSAFANEWGINIEYVQEARAIASEIYARKGFTGDQGFTLGDHDSVSWDPMIKIYGQDAATDTADPVLQVDELARAIAEGAFTTTVNSAGEVVFDAVDLGSVSNTTIVDATWAYVERNTSNGAERTNITSAHLQEASDYIVGPVMGTDVLTSDGEEPPVEPLSIFGEEHYGLVEGLFADQPSDNGTVDRFSKEAVQSIWDTGVFLQSKDFPADSGLHPIPGFGEIGYALSEENAAAVGETGLPEENVDHTPLADLYEVTPEHYANTYATAEAFLAEQPGGTIGMDTDYPNLDFHALLGVYGDKFQEFDMDAEGLTRAILDGAMSLPAPEAYTTSPINVVVDSTSSTSVALAVFEHARDGAASDDAAVPTSITAEELDVSLASVLLNSFDNYGPEHYDLMIAGFGDVEQPDGTFELSFEAVKSIFYNSVIHKDGSAEGMGYIPYQLDEVRLKAHDPDKDISLEVHVNPEDIPAEDAPYPVSEELETILSAGSGLTMAEIELLDETAAANVADRIDAITDADAPELVHYKQLMQLKTAAGDPDFAIHMDVDAVNADIQELMLTEPVATMLNETHEAAIVETFGVTGPEQAQNFLNFATNRETIQSIFALSATDREYVINHIVAIMARFDPDEAAEYSEMVLPLMLGEQVNYAVENNGRLMASADETVVSEAGEIELTEEAKAHRDEQVSRWLSFAISQPRNVGGASLEWVSSLRSASANDFNLIVERVSAFTQLSHDTNTTFGDWMEQFFSDANNGLEMVENYSGVPVQIREAEASGNLGQMWGIFAAFSVAMDASVIADKTANGEDLTTADYLQTAGDLMQMISGDYNGRQIFTSSAAEVVENFQKAKTSPFEIAVQEMALTEKTSAVATDIDTFTTAFNAAAVGDDAAKGEFVFNSPELVKALGIAGETEAEQKAVGAQYFNRTLAGLEAHGLETTEQVKEHFTTVYNAELAAESAMTGVDVGASADKQTFLSEFEIVTDNATDAELAERAAAAADSVVDFGINDGTIAGQRAVNVAARVWEDRAAEGLGAEGVSAGALEYVGYAGRKMGMFGAAANFAYAGVEITKAMDEYDEGHGALAGLHGAMAADFALIGTTSLLGTVASVSGATAAAAVLSATAGWGVFALIAFQLVTAVEEELQREADRDELEADFAKASLGELAREEQYYYVPGTTEPAPEPDAPDPWL